MYTRDDLENLSEEDKKRQRNTINMQVVMLDSDRRKLLAEKGALDAETKKLKIDEQRIMVSLGEKKKRLERLELEISQNEEEAKRMKKRLNVL